jgi:ubiquinol-cytochrome c reductase cytochrome c1 subunit
MDMLVMKKFLLAVAASLGLAMGAAPALAAGGGYPLDRFPTEKLKDQAALQNGAKLFVNYCLNCHSANLMRYNRLQDIGLTEAQIKENLLFTGGKVGDTMSIAMNPKDAKEWFGAMPPDLSVIARAKSSHSGTGSDWLYTYLRTYYRDSTRSTGWNNAVYENVGMPHILWPMEGSRGATITEIKAAKDEKGQASGFIKTIVNFDETGFRTEATEKIEGSGATREGKTIELTKAAGGQYSQADYDKQVADLVAYITYMSDPSAKTRTKVGVWVLIFLGIFTIFAWNLNRVYWKDIK